MRGPYWTNGIFINRKFRPEIFGFTNALIQGLFNVPCENLQING